MSFNLAYPKLMAVLLPLIFAACLSLVITPLIKILALRFEVIDEPSKRKVHDKPIPRIGGAAIYLAFLLSFLTTMLYLDLVLHYPTEPLIKLLSILLGSSMAFGIGLWDDFQSLRPSTKLLGQIAAALTACFLGGIKINVVLIPFFHDVSLGWLAIPVTVLWFLLVINAINLIDGLDGLAAGVTFFASIILMFLCMGDPEKVMATVAFAALAGAVLGFLRYNFNPASIFMGDCGSYYLGYMLAALSILGATKSHAAVAILIPIIALGLPMFDAILAPIRRFLMGKDPFKADKGHIHHKLIQLGLGQRKTVLLLYGISIILGGFAVLIVSVHDRRVGLVFILLAVLVIFGVRKLGYLEYIAMDKVVGYFQDVIDEVGFKRARRTFLERQIAINEAKTVDELWERVVDALTLLRFNEAEFRFNDRNYNPDNERSYVWQDADYGSSRNDDSKFLNIKLPIINNEKYYGTLILRKDLSNDNLKYYSFRRIELIRRNIISKMDKFEQTGQLSIPPADREIDHINEYADKFMGEKIFIKKTQKS